MIVFDLQCGNAHVFEAWFGSSADYTSQNKRHLIACPLCNNSTIKKAVMAPNVAAKGNQRLSHPSKAEPPETTQIVATTDTPVAGDGPSPAEMKHVMELMSDFQAKVEETHTDVGDKFPEEVRKIHYGEAEHKPIFGEATLKEAADLQEEGIDILPLPFRGKKSKRLDA
jgi:hypothetical protein